MELIIISSTKLKIMLNEGDMRKYSIGSDTDCTKPSTRKAIRRLLDCAKEQIGFNTEGEEIFVQLYTSKSGGCELFVTKTKESDEAILEEKRRMAAERLLESISPSRKAALPEKRGSSIVLRDNDKSAKDMEISSQSKSISHSFSSLKDLCRACKAMKNISTDVKSEAYSDDSGLFYLILTGTSIRPYNRLDKFSFLSEYGNRENADTISIYIREHGKVICKENAIQILGDL